MCNSSRALQHAAVENCCRGGAGCISSFRYLSQCACIRFPSVFFPVTYFPDQRSRKIFHGSEQALSPSTSKGSTCSLALLCLTSKNLRLMSFPSIAGFGHGSAAFSFITNEPTFPHYKGQMIPATRAGSLRTRPRVRSVVMDIPLSPISLWFPGLRPRRCGFLLAST